MGEVWGNITQNVETEPLTDEQVACLERLELEWRLFPSADAGSEIAIFGSAPKSGNCKSPNVRLLQDTDAISNS